MRCPVCQGRCTVPAGFYSLFGASVNTAREPCRRCDSTGTVEGSGDSGNYAVEESKHYVEQTLADHAIEEGS